MGYALIAYKFLSERFYLFLSIGFGFLWNAIYLVGVAYFKHLYPEDKSLGEFYAHYLTTIPSVISTLFFHYAVFLDPEIRRKTRGIYNVNPLFLASVILLFIIVGIISNQFVSDKKLWIVIFKLPVVTYNLLILLAISFRFFSSFLTDEYGHSAELIYLSWAGYAILQPFAVLNVFDNDYAIKYMTAVFFFLRTAA